MKDSLYSIGIYSCILMYSAVLVNRNRTEQAKVFLKGYNTHFSNKPGVLVLHQNTRSSRENYKLLFNSFITKCLNTGRNY